MLLTDKLIIPESNSRVEKILNKLYKKTLHLEYNKYIDSYQLNINYINQ